MPEKDEMNPYTRRETEIDLVKRGYQPLSAVRDMLGSQSTKGIHFLRAAELRLSSRGVWTSQQDGLSITAIETYPAVARKHAAVSARCAQILAQPPLNPPENAGGKVHKDVEDALICALVAHFFSDLSSGIEPVPPAAAELEGWIILPRNIATVE